MNNATVEREPVVAPPIERAQLAEIERLLDVSVQRPAKLIGPAGTETELPNSLYEVLLRAVRELVIGNGVSILPSGMELTTQKAADLLNVSRPHVIALIKRGELPHHKVGTHRRLRLTDVLTYKARRDQVRRAALDQLTREAEDDGLYEHFYAAGQARLAKSSQQ